MTRLLLPEAQVTGQVGPDLVPVRQIPGTGHQEEEARLASWDQRLHGAPTIQPGGRSPEEHRRGVFGHEGDAHPGTQAPRAPLLQALARRQVRDGLDHSGGEEITP